MKLNIKHVCEQCNKEAEPNKEKSNENWKVYDTICRHCGGKVKMQFD
ncbi:hypothetical protein [Brevibacillus sp. MER 51]|nr:hypothetical protein [Brevibacillus sp. MER 51]MCM3141685.1 hypothetical protein [Brevibacillus sp. MER 51]